MDPPNIPTQLTVTGDSTAPRMAVSYRRTARTVRGACGRRASHASVSAAAAVPQHIPAVASMSGTGTMASQNAPAEAVTNMVDNADTDGTATQNIATESSTTPAVSSIADIGDMTMAAQRGSAEATTTPAITNMADDTTEGMAAQNTATEAITTPTATNTTDAGNTATLPMATVADTRDVANGTCHAACSPLSIQVRGSNDLAQTQDGRRGRTAFEGNPTSHGIEAPSDYAARGVDDLVPADSRGGNDSGHHRGDERRTKRGRRDFGGAVNHTPVVADRVLTGTPGRLAAPDLPGPPRPPGHFADPALCGPAGPFTGPVFGHHGDPGFPGTPDQYGAHNYPGPPDHYVAGYPGRYPLPPPPGYSDGLGPNTATPPMIGTQDGPFPGPVNYTADQGGNPVTPPRPQRGQTAAERLLSLARPLVRNTTSYDTEAMTMGTDGAASGPNATNNATVQPTGPNPTDTAQAAPNYPSYPGYEHYGPGPCISYGPGPGVGLGVGPGVPYGVQMCPHICIHCNHCGQFNGHP
jgi:hypothetical protein